MERLRRNECFTGSQIITLPAPSVRSGIKKGQLIVINATPNYQRIKR